MARRYGRLRVASGHHADRGSLLTVVLNLPSLLLWAAVASAGKPTRITDVQFAWGLLLAAVLGIAAWTVGHWYGPDWHTAAATG